MLAWLSVLAYHNPDSSQPLISVKEIQDSYWRAHGRHYYSRYDYDGLTKEQAKKVLHNVVVHLNGLCEEEAQDSKC